MTKIMKNVRTRDEAFSIAGSRSRVRTRDEVLNAISPGKCLALGTVWDGSLEPFISTAVENLGGLVAPGLTPGHTLGAEPTPVQVQLQGRTWTDSILHQIGAAIHEIRSGETEDDLVNLEPVHKHTHNLQEALESGDRRAMGVAFDSLRGACDAIRRSRSQAVKTGDIHTGPASKLFPTIVERSTRDSMQTFGDRERARIQSNASINDANAAWWKHNRASFNPPTPAQPYGDGRIAAINKSNADFWAKRKT